MGEDRTQTTPTRRSLLKSAGALLVGGVIGYATTSFSAPSKPAADAPPALPWPWIKIDPMEAGARAYHYYHDLGG